MDDGAMPEPHLDPQWTVNETIRRFPATVAVFNVFGIDACCGGSVPLAEAALRDGTDPDALVQALREAVRAA